MKNATALFFRSPKQSFALAGICFPSPPLFSLQFTFARVPPTLEVAAAPKRDEEEDAATSSDDANEDDDDEATVRD